MPVPEGDAHALSTVEAGELLDLPPDVVRALADAGYLRVVELRSGTPRFALGDLKAFEARLTEGIDGGDSEWRESLDLESRFDPALLLATLEGRSAAMAERTLQRFAAVFPGVESFTEPQREAFLAEARSRIDGIVEVCVRGPDEIEPLEDDFEELGADAAHAGVPLPHILFSLRASRDLVVQTAIEVAEERGGRWGVVLAAMLTRIVPSIDLLGDALARGYWDSMIEIEAETAERFRNLADQSNDGVFDVDSAGNLRYLNPTLVRLVGVPVADLVGRPVSEVLDVAPGASGEVAVGGVTLVVTQVERLRHGMTVGWDGLVVAAPPG